MRKLNELLSRLFYGRYGIDELCKFQLWVYIGVAVFSIVWKSSYLYLIETVLLVLLVFRSMSRNIIKRRAELYKYLSIKKKFTEYLSLQKKRWGERTTHVYKKCPSCKATLRLRKQKGEHSVACPKCGNHFDVNIR